MQRHSHWPLTTHWKRVVSVSIGVMLALTLVGFLANLTHRTLLVASLGASSVLLFAYPDSAFSQPRNFLGGNVICALIGLTAIHLIGAFWMTAVLATGLALAAMMFTDTLHPPAASTPLIIYTFHSGWSFLIFPNLCGDIVILVVALVYHRITRKERYPHYWI